MTPSNIRDRLEEIQGELCKLDDIISKQKKASVGYYSVGHEIVEANDCIIRALEELDAVALGLV